MKEIKLEIKDTYSNVVEFIHKNFEITEPTKFTFTKIVETNAKMRRRSAFKNVYSYETEGCIILNDNNHKENLFRKICIPTIGTEYVDFAKMGID